MLKLRLDYVIQMNNRRKDASTNGISFTNALQLIQRVVCVIHHVDHLALMKDCQLGYRVSYIYNKVHVFTLLQIQAAK